MKISLEKPELNELTHFGVLGMKWGVRQKQPKSQAVLKAELKVQKTKEKLKTHKTTNKVYDHKFAKEDLKNTKILEKLQSKPKTKSQLALEKKYKDKGLTSDEAAVAAYKNIRTKKILATVGAMTLAAAAGYAAYKIHNDRTDKIIKSGTALQNITNDPTKSIREDFYAATHKQDKIKYQGFFGAQLAARGDVYKKEVQVLTDIKRASPKMSRDTFVDLVKNESSFSKYKNLPTKTAYNQFNQNLVDHSPLNQKRIDTFYQALHNKGYNAILDVNDMKFSGYKAKDPTIYFKMKDLVTVANNEPLAKASIQKSYATSIKSLRTAAEVKKGAAYSGALLALMGVSKSSSNQLREEKIATYKKEHPNTKMSYTEISRMLERGDG